MFSLSTKKMLSRTPMKQFSRRLCSSDTASKKAALDLHKSKLSEGNEGKEGINPKIIYACIAMAATGGCIYNIQTDKKGVLGSMYWGTPVEEVITEVYQYLFGWMNEMFIPYEDKLLPTWPTDPVR